MNYHLYTRICLYYFPFYSAELCRYIFYIITLKPDIKDSQAKYQFLSCAVSPKKQNSKDCYNLFENMVEKKVSNHELFLGVARAAVTRYLIRDRQCILMDFRLICRFNTALKNKPKQSCFIRSVLS